MPWLRRAAFEYYWNPVVTGFWRMRYIRTGNRRVRTYYTTPIRRRYISTGWWFVRLIGQKRPCLVGNRFTRSLKRIENRVHKFLPSSKGVGKDRNPTSKIRNDCRQFSNLTFSSISYVINDGGKSQNVILFIRGNGISGDSCISGINQFSNPPIKNDI